MEKIEYAVKTLGVELTVTGPKNAADLNNLAGDPRATEKAFITMWWYQDRAPAVRAQVCVEAEALTGVARGRKQNLNADGSPKKTRTGEDSYSFTETEDTYLSNLVESKVITQEDLNGLIKKVNEDLGEFSWTAGKSAKPNKVFYSIADDLLAKIENGKLKPEKVIKNLESQGGVAFDAAVGEFNRDNLARYLEIADRKQKERLAALAGESGEEGDE